MVKSSNFHQVGPGSIPGADVFQEFSKSSRFSKFCEKTWNQQLLLYYSINSATLEKVKDLNIKKEIEHVNNILIYWICQSTSQSSVKACLF